MIRLGVLAGKGRLLSSLTGGESSRGFFNLRQRKPARYRTMPWATPSPEGRCAEWRASPSVPAPPAQELGLGQGQERDSLW